MLIVVGIIFYMTTKVITLNPFMWKFFFGINITLNAVGAFILLLYIREETKKNKE